jgi:hypothetical protein
MDTDKYKNAVPYPEKQDYTKYNLYYKGKVLGARLTAEERDKLKESHPGATVEKDFDESAYKTAHLAYQEGESDVIERFWRDFAKEEGISTNHPKFEILKRYAWDHGHSSGFNEIWNYAIGLVDFLK